ncbi:MAG: penicillin-binding protein 2 [Bacteroidales bacterium]|nr:penicillin-binding protein 2 [Bacteroidales bacterium]
MNIYPGKRNVIMLVLLVIFLVMAVRLFVIQIVDKRYSETAGNNALKYVTVYPARGRILDRNGNTIVENKITYDIMVSPRLVEPFDTLAICEIFNLEPEFVHERFAQYRDNARKIGYGSMPFLKQVSSEQYNAFAEKEYLFPGFDAVARTARIYPVNAGGNLIGYVSEVDRDYIEKHPEYRSGDYAGKTGMERAFEKRLCGEKGYTVYYRDARGRIKGHYDNGAIDKAAVAGSDIITTIDAGLQEYGETLMRNKVGSLVAIEPSTGEILSLVSSPGIGVSQLAEIGKYYKEISENPYNPMFNRTVQSAQPPGSVFKLVNGLIGMQEGVLTRDTWYPCNHGYTAGKVHVGCHYHASPINLPQSVAMSCNAYYCYVLRSILENRKYANVEEAFEKWREYVTSFGFGRKLGSDVPYELGGNVPTVNTYNKLHGKGRWRALSVISLSIGQGELGCTPLQIANLAATIANRGWFYTPHMIKGDETHPLDSAYCVRNYPLVDKEHFDVIVEGMSMSVYGDGGTSHVAQIPGIQMCGKTGTAQNPHGDDHSVFICFAPKDDPKIAVAAYIENGGFGASWAAPIASLLVEKYLNGEISPARQDLETRVKNGNLLYKVPVKKKRR